jgi:glycosyltransferase involved in cell wall biosynthesis
MEGESKAGPPALEAVMPSARGTSGNVVHVIGWPRESVMTHVGAITRALADSGTRQTVILLDRPGRRDLLPRIDARVRIVLCRAGEGPGRAWPALLQTLCEEVQGPAVPMVHLHGVVACVLGGFAARFRGLPAPLYFSPYGSGAWWPLNRAAALLLWALRPRHGEPSRRTITSRSTDVDMLRQLTGQPVDLVEASVDSAYFEVRRREARRPLVVTSSRAADPRSAALFAQLAVLLGEESLGLGFNWVGVADAESLAQLNAAGVGWSDPADDGARVARLRSAWLYVATDSTNAFPACLVEAMAMGLPCVAWDTPQHRDVLRHGQTGLLCDSESAMLASVASLIDSSSLRTTLGRAARAAALQRFHPSRFNAALQASYRSGQDADILAGATQRADERKHERPQGRGLPIGQGSE